MKIVMICMGSSCFSRGNRSNLDLIESFLSRHRLTKEVQVRGTRCENRCAKGPVILIDGTCFDVPDLETLEVILRRNLLPQADVCIGSGENP